MRGSAFNQPVKTAKHHDVGNIKLIRQLLRIMEWWGCSLRNTHNIYISAGKRRRRRLGGRSDRAGPGGSKIDQKIDTEMSWFEDSFPDRFWGSKGPPNGPREPSFCRMLLPDPFLLQFRCPGTSKINVFSMCFNVFRNPTFYG